MMTKTMVSEVKESADRRKADEQHLRTLSMAHRCEGLGLQRSREEVMCRVCARLCARGSGQSAGALRQ